VVKGTQHESGCRGGGVRCCHILSEDEEIRNAEDGGLRVCASRGVIGVEVMCDVAEFL